MRLFALRARVPIRLRFFFRAAFALLALATLALAVTVLREEKQRAQHNELEALKQLQAQISARLRHPTGQLALLNLASADRAMPPVRPWLLPLSAIGFDDKTRAQQAVEMTGCELRYPDTATLCVAVGNNPMAGGFIYVIGSVVTGPLAAHTPGELDFSNAHRLHIEVAMRGERYAWVAPYEDLPEARGPGRQGRLTGFDAQQPITHGTRQVRDFRGWLWQDGRCVDATADPSTCTQRAFMSVRLPIDIFRIDLANKRLVWPPPDLDAIEVSVRLLPPGEGAAPLFDSAQPGAQRAFSFNDLRELLRPGETLRVRPLGPDGQPRGEALQLRGDADTDEPTSPWLVRLIQRLPVDRDVQPVALEAREVITTASGRHELLLTGDPRGLDRNLAAVATRLSGFVGAMLAAVVLTWLAIELRIIRRITLLTKRSAQVSVGVRGSEGLGSLDLSDLRGSDELGVLAQGLKDLLQRVNDDVRREQIRTEQEKDQWHAVGHEIMSPLQSLMVLHGDPADPSHRYISRMQQAVRVLYGQASPSEAFEATTLQLQTMDLREFLAHVADNAPHAGIEPVVFDDRAGPPVQVRADEYSLEDAMTHVLRNAQRYRVAGTPIRIGLTVEGLEARVSIHNQGPAIPEELIDRIFEYGVSDQAAGEGEGQRGQGLFVARTYLAKMGGAIRAKNVPGGVSFDMTCPLAAR